MHRRLITWGSVTSPSLCVGRIGHEDGVNKSEVADWCKLGASCVELAQSDHLHPWSFLPSFAAEKTASRKTAINFAVASGCIAGICPNMLMKPGHSANHGHHVSGAVCILKSRSLGKPGLIIRVLSQFCLFATFHLPQHRPKHSHAACESPL